MVRKMCHCHSWQVEDTLEVGRRRNNAHVTKWDGRQLTALAGVHLIFAY